MTVVFPAPVGADDRQSAAGGYKKVDVMQGFLAGLIVEGNASKFNFPSNV
jgi:hypothetical protein